MSMGSVRQLAQAVIIGGRMSDGVFVRCKHRSDDAEKRRVVLNMPTRYTAHIHETYAFIIYWGKTGFVGQLDWNGSARILIRLISYTPGQMVIILARVMGREKGWEDFCIFVWNGFIFPGCGTNFCFMYQYYITLWVTYLRPNVEA